MPEDVEIVRNIFLRFEDRIKELKRQDLFSENWITQYANYQSQSRCHSRIVGTLTRIGYNLGFTVDIGRKWSLRKPYLRGKERSVWQIYPDLTYIDAESDRPYAFIEYESLDQPFNAIRKIPQLEHYVLNPKNEEAIPKACVIVITLPKVKIGEIKGAQKWIKSLWWNLDIANWIGEADLSEEKSLWDYYYEPSISILKVVKEDTLKRTLFSLGILWEKGVNVIIKSGKMMENMDLAFS